MGLERTGGFTTEWQVECDPFCQSVLGRHWPDSTRAGQVEDITHVGAQGCGRVDLLCGGFPCQDISNAGNKQGIQGERSGLWSEFARVIAEFRPEYVLVENVAALRYKGRGLGVVLRDLAKIGYDAEWHCIQAAALGAPQRRDRIFILAYPAGVRQPESRIIWEDPCGYAPSEGWETTDAVDAIRRGALPAMCSEHNGVSLELDRSAVRALGNAVVPQVTEFIGQQILKHGHLA